VQLFTTEELIAMDPGINRPGGHTQEDELLAGQNLPLYGRSDHSQQAPLTLLDKQKMAVRSPPPFLLPQRHRCTECITQICGWLGGLSALLSCSSRTKYIIRT